MSLMAGRTNVPTPILRGLRASKRLWFRRWKFESYSRLRVIHCVWLSIIKWRCAKFISTGDDERIEQVGGVFPGESVKPQSYGSGYCPEKGMLMIAVCSHTAFLPLLRHTLPNLNNQFIAIEWFFFLDRCHRYCEPKRETQANTFSEWW